MKPTLLTLFQRGRYCRLPSAADGESEELVRARREAERFTSAAVGFCIVHHARFRRFFIEKMCGLALSPRARCEVDIEPEHWADLMVHFGRRKVTVIEFKLGAPLQSHQNPGASEFWEKPNGYGALLGQAYPKHEKHFIVLGARERLQLPERASWLFRQVGWAELATDFDEHFHRTPLLGDLRDCLAQFGVWEFARMKASKFSVRSSAATGASMAWEILWTAYTAPDLKLSIAPSFSRIDAEFTRPNQWHFGIEVLAGASPSLLEVTRPSSGGAVLWFGYECGRNGEVWLSIWLYCENEALADEIAARFRPGKHSSDKPQRGVNDKGHRTDIGIRGRPSYGTTDLDWFAGWLSTLCGWAQHHAKIAPIKRRRR